jgi:cysteine desulfurase
MLAMKDVAVASGSACSSADPESSHVLRSIGLTDDQARSTLRFSLGRFNTGEDVEFAARRVIETVTELRRLRQMI